MSSLALFYLRGEIKEVHLKKDVGLFPLYLGKEYFDSTEIVKIGTKDEASLTLGDIKFRDLFFEERVDDDSFMHSKKYELKCVIKSFFYLLKHKNISHIMIFNVTRFSLGLSFLVKIFMPKRKIYLKLDANTDIAKSLSEKPKKITQKIFYNFVSFIDFISVETQQNFEIIKKNPVFEKKLNLIPNGFEKPLEISELKKENIILTVGSIGLPVKNSEILLNSLKNIDLKDWKFYFVGPISEDFDFKNALNDFYENHPEKKENVIFSGAIYDKKQLDSFYQRAKVFILPSKYESFGIATIEAASYGDFLVLTDTGCARDIVLGEDFGIILPNSTTEAQTDDSLSKSISKTLQKIIDGEIKTDSNLDERKKRIYEKFAMENIVKSEVFKNWAKIQS